MIPQTTNRPAQEGFTLVEIIVSLVLISIMAALLAQAMGRSLEQSATPVRLVQEQYELINAMEDLIERYRYQIDEGALNLTAFNSTYVNDAFLNCSATGVCVDTARTGFQTLTSQAGTYTTQSTILLVTLKQASSGGMTQRVQAVFTE